MFRDSDEIEIRNESNCVKKKYGRKKPLPKSKSFRCRQNRKRKRDEVISIIEETIEIAEEAEDEGESHMEVPDVGDRNVPEVEHVEVEDAHQNTGSIGPSEVNGGIKVTLSNNPLSSSRSKSIYCELDDATELNSGFNTAGQVYSTEKSLGNFDDRDHTALNHFKLDNSKAISSHVDYSLACDSFTACNVINTCQVNPNEKSSGEWISEDSMILDFSELDNFNTNNLHANNTLTRENFSACYGINASQACPNDKSSGNRNNGESIIQNNSKLDNFNSNNFHVNYDFARKSFSTFYNIDPSQACPIEKSSGTGNNKKSMIQNYSELDDTNAHNLHDSVTEKSDFIDSDQSQASQICSEQSAGSDQDLEDTDLSESCTLDSSNDDLYSVTSETSSHSDVEFVDSSDDDNGNDDSESKENSHRIFDTSPKSSSHQILSSSSDKNRPKDSQPLFPNDRKDIYSIISGCRITDFAYFWSQLQCLGNAKNHHANCGRRLTDHEIVDCQDIGLNSLLYFRCFECGFIGKIYTNPPNPEKGFEINKTAALSVIGSGSTFAAFQTILAVFNIPYPSHKTYQKHRKELTEPLHDTLSHEMRLNAQKEAEFAIKNGDVTANGIPCITIIIDGFYMKRSFKGSKYDSLGAVVTAIGNYTKKVIDVEVLNKYCYKCTKYEKLNMKPPPHKCYKNFDRNKSSSSMEQEGTLRIIERSEKLHGLIYETLVADDDSGTYKTVRDAKPYYRTHRKKVKRILCCNHQFRSMGTKIRKASLLGKKNQRGIGVARAKVKASGLKIRKLITCNIERLRKELDNNSLTKDEKQKMFEKNTEILRQIILIAPYHVFGDHSKCPSDWSCDKSKPNHLDLIKKYDLFTRVEKIIDDLSKNADHLLHFITTNPVEQYHGLLAKYLGGKRVQYGASDENNDRVYMGALDQVTSGTALSTFYKFSNFDVPERVSKLEREKNLQKTTNAKCRQANKKNKKRRFHSGPDQNYGPNAAKPDLSDENPEQYKKKILDHHEKLRNRQKNRIALEKETKNQLIYGEPHVLERDMIPTLFVGKICKMLESTSCIPVIADICYPCEEDDEVLDSMSKHRENALQKLESQIGHKIKLCGLIFSTDDESFYLCGRPDGLVDDDSIVIVTHLSDDQQISCEEALLLSGKTKNLFLTKAPNEINVNHPTYFIIQGELHVTGRKSCYFAVYTSNDLKLAAVIQRDDSFWDRRMKTKLNRFYLEALIPEIIDSRVERSMPIREPSFTVEAIAKRDQKKADKLSQEKSQIIDGELSENVSQPSIEQNDSTILIRDDYDEETVNIYRQLVLARTFEEYIHNILEANVYLDDISIARFLFVLEKKNFTVPLPVTILNPLQKSTTNDDLFILGGEKNRSHWCCVHFDGKSVAIYDSLKDQQLANMSEVERHYLEVRYPHQFQQNLIEFKNVTTQPDGSSCGAYAAAFATTIALGGDPCVLNYSEDAAVMRQHFLFQIIERDELVEFPSTPKILN